MIKTAIEDSQVQATFARLRAAASDPRPLMQEIGEYTTESVKQRFAEGRAPDGSTWAPNAPSTYVRLVAKSKSATDKKGRLTKAGAARVMGKRPLIGETRALSTTIFYQAGRDYVEIGSPMEYAGVMQYGARARSFTGGKTPWGDIPARPFLGLSDQDTAAIAEMGYRYLERVSKGE
jgi:phage virion morphogenesis protein